jgi:DNA-binding response OmpR family regulator
LRILLVEDHADTARVLRRLLKVEGHSVEWGADVAAGLKLAADHEFDLLLSDLGLPDGTGVDLMRTLREKGSTLPGIVISGYGQDQDIARSLEVGFAAHLVKPINLRKLREAIVALVSS